MQTIFCLPKYSIYINLFKEKTKFVDPLKKTCLKYISFSSKIRVNILLTNYRTVERSPELWRAEVIWSLKETEVFMLKYLKISLEAMAVYVFVLLQIHFPAI